MMQPLAKNHKLPSFALRLKVVGALFAVLGVLGLSKAFMLQVSRGDALRRLSDQQAIRPIEYVGERGNIYDRNGHLLSTSVAVDSIFAQPRSLTDPDKATQLLGPLLGRSQIKDKLHSNKAFAWLARRVDPNVSKAVANLDLSGIGFMDEQRRFYPNHALLGQVVGLVSIDETAKSGVELAFDDLLSKSSWKTVARVDAKGDMLRQFLAPSLLDLSGSDIYLTIDREIQHVAEVVLQKTVAQHNAKGGFALAMNPKTGEILAMANVPMFNPNLVSKDNMPWIRNQAIARTMEPGSTFKIITFAAALEAQVIRADEEIDCENGVYDLGYMVIRDVAKRKMLTPVEIFKLSSNIGTYKIADRVGKDRLYETIKAFGYGQLPGLGLIEEAKGSVSDPSSWGKTRFANISFGYGLMSTPLQTLVAAATIANKGVRVSPTIIKRIVKPDQTEPKRPPVESRRVLSEKTALQLIGFMKADTETGGTGAKASILGVHVAGKTGTTEKLDETTKRYSKAKNMASFVGFAPADDAQVAVLVVIDEPSGIAYGGVVAAPAFQQIATAALNKMGLLGIPYLAK